MTELTCTHGMPSPASCIECMEDGPVAPPRPSTPEIQYEMVAKFGGICNHCFLPLIIGDDIAMMTNGEIWHVDCTD